MKESKEFRNFLISRLTESKENIIKKLNNLTDEQKQIAIEFFNNHNAWEREIDWNKGQKLTWEDDFVPVIYRDRNTNSQKAKKTKQELHKAIEGLEEGTDYLYLANGSYNGYPWTLYQPLSYKGSKVLASNYVPPARTDNNSRGNQFSGARWCISWGDTNQYWNKHSNRGREAFLFLFGESVPTKKLAISISTIPDKKSDADGQNFNHISYIRDTQEDIKNYYFNIWDYEDDKNSVSLDEVKNIIDLDKYIKEAIENYSKIENYEENTSEKNDVIAEYGADAADAYEELYGDIESYDDFDEAYQGYYDDVADYIMEYFWDVEVDRTTACDFLDLNELGNNLIENDYNNLDAEEFMNIYGSQGAKIVGDDDDDSEIDWNNVEIDYSDVDSEEVARTYVWEILGRYPTLRDIDDEFSSYLDWDYIERYFIDDYDSYNGHYFRRY